MNEILEAVKLRLRFDDSGEFEKALLKQPVDENQLSESLDMKPEDFVKETD